MRRKLLASAYVTLVVALVVVAGLAGASCHPVCYLIGNDPWHPLYWVFGCSECTWGLPDGN